MRISAKGEYAILAILDLAEVYETGEIHTLEEISKDQSIPHPFLVQILLELKRAGIVESRRGAGGGYRLAMHPRDISLGEVIRQIEGPLLPFKCILPTVESHECPHHGNCVLTAVWRDVRRAIETVIDNVSFEDLARRRENLSSPMFHI
ncbi:MAG: Rrf2 family transcriptional regulator [Candidatus Omnitrophota bacterium]|jgi:Rrf2 family protein|nr:MAG: Rrf2 family transcriptional regulator [Candidatus Omnitrophota bacterium]